MRGDRDHALVRRSIDGDGKAFRQIVEKHVHIVYSAVRAVVGNSDEADDIVQDIYVKIYRGLPGFRGNSSLSTWIYRIARNEAVNAARRKRIALSPVERSDLMASENDRPDIAYGRKHNIERIRDLIARLDDRYREVIELRYFGDKTYSEISELLQVPEGTVKTYLYRAKSRMREMIRKEGGAGGKDRGNDGL